MSRRKPAELPKLPELPDLPHDEVVVRTFDDTELHARVYGPRAAPAVVFVHGWCCRSEYWTPQVRDLAATHRVVVFDQRGHGRNSQSPDTFTIAALGRDLDAVPDATLAGGERALLVGHSLGGVTILSWAREHPDRVSSKAYAVLLAGTGMGRLAAETRMIPFPGRFAAVRRPVLRALVGSSLPWPPPRASLRMVKRVALTPTASDTDARFVQQIAYACPAPIRGAWGRVLSGLDLNAGAAGLSVPTAVMVGAEDRMLPPRLATAVAAVLERTGHLEQSTVLPGVGHCLNVEAVGAFDAEVRRLAGAYGRAIGNSRTMP